MKYGSKAVSTMSESRIIKKIASLTAVAMLLFSTMAGTGSFSGVALAAGEPVVTITAQPNNPTNDTAATFTFTADPSADTFSCRLDGGTWDPCTSPHEILGLTEGLHTLEVNGTNGNGTGLQETVAWEIDLTPPDTYIWIQPSDPSTDTTPTFNFYSNDGSATLECSIDAGPFTACTAPYTTSPLSIGMHDFAVRAIDLAGNIDSTPATYSWEIISPDNIIITDCEELQDIDNSLSTIGGTYILANDIDCSMTNPDSPSFDIGGTWGDSQGFLPIGDSNGAFDGYFDGNGYMISGMYINRNSDIGLFAEIGSDGVVTNLTIANPIVYGGYNVGALAGSSNGTISNINITNMNISGENSVGGVIGNSDSGDADNIHADGDLEAAGDESGGLYGYFEDGNLSNCSFSGTLSTYYESGGIVGENEGPATIHRCFSEGSITAGSTDVGGIIGEVEDEMTITESFSTMTVDGDDAGGLVGTVYGDLTLSDSYFNGLVTGGDDSGSVIGYISTSYNATITNTYGTGSVDGGTVGGFLGDSGTGDTFVNSFWDINTTGLTDGCDPPSGCVGVLGKTTAQMKNIATFTTDLGNDAWDFEGIWGIEESVNDGYPCLRWASICDELDGISDEIENNAPNNGDANDDGDDDADQDNVTSFVSDISGKYISIETSCGQAYPQNTDVSVEAENASFGDVAFQYPAGLMNFTFDCASTATVAQYVYGDFDNTTITVRKYNPVTHTYTTISNAVVTKEVIGGEKVLKIVYQIADNGPLDLNAEVGVITDPAGPAVLAVGVPNTGLGRRK